MRFNRKASLEMSIQAIVIVVLAMTLLGLGLGFIKGMFRNITSTTEDVSEQVRQKVLDDLVQGDKRISFPKTEVEIDKGGSTVLTIGIKNKQDKTLFYLMNFRTMKVSDSISPDNVEQKKAEFNLYFQYDRKMLYTLAAAQADVRSIRLNLRNIESGSYLIRFDVKSVKLDQNGVPVDRDCDPQTNCESYDTKDFFVIVRG